MEGPERLVANWGAKGLMADLSDLWTDDQKADISASVEAACKDSSGAYYEFPLCMTAHCYGHPTRPCLRLPVLCSMSMPKPHLTTDNFLKAVQAVYTPARPTSARSTAAPGRRQGTRAIINNMYGGTFTDAAHTKYTADSAENIKAIEALYNQDGINFDASINGARRSPSSATAPCRWPSAGTLPSRPTLTTAQPARPTAATTSCSWRSRLSPATPALLRRHLGFGVFDNGDENKIAASKTFINFMANSTKTAKAVKTSTYFSVRTLCPTCTRTTRS